MTRSTQCFISYGHGDHKSFDALLPHLKAATDLFSIPLWSDTKLKVGVRFNEAILTKVEESNIFVFVTTNHFFSSDFIKNKEMPAIMHKHRNNGALLVPIIFQESCWRHHFGEYIHVTPHNHRGNLLPIRQWRDREEGIAVAVNEVIDAIEDWFGVKASGFPLE